MRHARTLSTLAVAAVLAAPVSARADADGPVLLAQATGATGVTGATGATVTPAAPAPAATTGPTAASGVPASTDPDPGSDTAATLGLVVLAVLGGLALLALLAAGLARALAYDPPWLASGRHATAEAGWRISATWAEFSDWLRLGR